MEGALLDEVVVEDDEVQALPIKDPKLLLAVDVQSVAEIHWLIGEYASELPAEASWSPGCTCL